MKWTLAILICFQSMFCFAQSGKRINDFAEATFAFGSYQGSLSLLYVHNWRLGSSRKFGVGLGGRITSYLGANQYYITAPAEITSESTSPLIFFKENVEANIDSLLIQSPQVNAINASINLDYRLTPKLTAGFNIDFIGFSFGATKRGNYINGQQGKITEGKPTPFNILLISDNDKGSLNSELNLKYEMNKKWSAKLGAQFLFTEYTTETQVQQSPAENDRFRRKSLMFALGMSYQLNKD